MPTVGQARENVSRFLQETGCYSICANCPVYPGGVGCCAGCSKLVHGKGCSDPNLSCLTYTCSVLNMHLSGIKSETHVNKLEEFVAMVYPLPREGYRGCEKLPDSQIVELSDPLEINAIVGIEGAQGEHLSQG